VSVSEKDRVGIEYQIIVIKLYIVRY